MSQSLFLSPPELLATLLKRLQQKTPLPLTRLQPFYACAEGVTSRSPRVETRADFFFSLSLSFALSLRHSLKRWVVFRQRSADKEGEYSERTDGSSCLFMCKFGQFLSPSFSIDNEEPRGGKSKSGRGGGGKHKSHCKESPTTFMLVTPFSQN